jgi:hypothetical protein
MAKILTDAELAELQKKGTVTFDPQDTNIARFGELIDKLNELISQNAARTQADLARSQVQLEVLGAIQKSINQQKRGVTQSHPVDLSPLREILEELKGQKERTAYRFDIQRGEGGYMAGVTATPIEPVRH